SRSPLRSTRSITSSRIHPRGINYDERTYGWLALGYWTSWRKAVTTHVWVNCFHGALSLRIVAGTPVFQNPRSPAIKPLCNAVLGRILGIPNAPKTFGVEKNWRYCFPTLFGIYLGKRQLGKSPEEVVEVEFQRLQ